MTKQIELPKDLAGYQSLCGEVMQADDLCIPNGSISCNEWRYAKNTGFVGKTTSWDGEYGLDTLAWRIYRLNACPQKLDNTNNRDDTYKALTNDKGKPPLALLPWAGLNEVSMVQSYGNEKYGDYYNYRKGMEINRHLSCAMRHIQKFIDGEDLDTESKRSHLAHAACRLLYVLQNQHDGTAIDDRFKKENKQ